MQRSDLFAGTQFLVISGKRNSQGKLLLHPRGLFDSSQLTALTPEDDRPELLFAPFPMTDGNAMPSKERAGDGGHLVWCDVDHRLKFHQEQYVEDLDAWTLKSGTPGRRQVFIRLASATPAHQIEALNRALCEKLGGDQSKISRAAIMRLPAGFNTKGGKRRPAEFDRESERVWSAPELAAALGTELPDADVHSDVQSMRQAPKDALRAVEPSKRNNRAERALRDANSRYESGNQSDRDSVLWGLYKDLARSHTVKGVPGPGVTDGGHILWYALRCDAAKHDDRWVAGDVARFLRSHDYAQAVTTDSVGVLDASAGERLEVAAKPKPKRRASRFISRQELGERPEPKWLIERLIPEYGIGQLFGPTYGGKTYAAIDLVMRVTTGMNHWIGHTIALHGPVFYVLMEGGFDFGKRLDAWEMKYGRTSDELYVMVEEELNLDNPESLEQLAEDITAVSATPRLLVIDTQSLAIQGVEENDNTGMNGVMQKLKRLSKALGCFVLLVHHTGYATEDRGRGASAQPAALDTIIRIKGSDKNGRTIDVTKVKAGREVKERNFRLEEQKNGWPAFVEITGMEALEQHISNEDKIIRFLKWNGPLAAPQIAEGIEVAYSTVANLCRDLTNPEKCPRGEKPKLVIAKTVGNKKFYDIADHLKDADAPDPADL